MLLLNVGFVVSTLRPTVFIAENVPGAIAGKHKYYWEGLRSTLVAAGYRTFDLRLEAIKLGIPQMRKRIAMIGWRSGKDVEFTLPSIKGKVLRDAFSKMDGLPNHEKKLLPVNCDPKKIAIRIKEGQKLSNVRGGPNSVHTWDIPEVFGYVTAPEKEILNLLLKMRRQHRLRDRGDADPVPLDRITEYAGSKAYLILKSLIAKGYVMKKGRNFDLTHTFNGKYRRLSWDEPSLTVDTRFGDPRYFLHPNEDRGFTVREAARIQGFPDNFIFSGPEKMQYQVIGNAVPPTMAEALASIVIKLL
jgi:DNA (cytosine-5)-methyltransferase 1